MKNHTNNMQVSRRDNERNTMISKDYVPAWGSWEAIRELIQNHADGCSLNGTEPVEAETTNYVDFDFYNKKGKQVGQIQYEESSSVLRISNRGSIYTQALLLGGTDKAGVDGAIGTHGEGGKLAALALLRNKCSVRVTSNGYTWKYFLKEDSTFLDANEEAIECLWLKLEEDPKVDQNKEKVIVEVTGLSLQEWKAYTKRFLWLTPSVQPGMIKTPHGTLLIDNQYRGQVFVKKIFICEYPNQRTANGPTGLYWSYDFDDLPLNRDRKGIEDLNQRHARTSKILAWVVNNFSNPDIRNLLNAEQELILENEFLSTVFRSLKSNCHETYYFAANVKEGAPRIWNVWEAEQDASIQPIHPHHVSGLNDFLTKHKLPIDFYRSTINGVSHQSWPVLRKCSGYETVQNRYKAMVNSLAVVELNDAQHQAVEWITTRLKPCTNSTVQIQFVESDKKEFVFVDKAALKVSSDMLQRTDFRSVLLAHCLDKLPIDMVQFCSVHVQGA